MVLGMPFPKTTHQAQKKRYPFSKTVEMEMMNASHTPSEVHMSKKGGRVRDVMVSICQVHSRWFAVFPPVSNDSSKACVMTQGVSYRGKGGDLV
jgi:hypothetical protein